MTTPLEDYSSYEFEANAPVVAMTHHIHIPRGCQAERIISDVVKSMKGRMDDDEMREIEPGQQFTGYNFLR